MGCSYGRAGRLTALSGGVRPGQGCQPSRGSASLWGKNGAHGGAIFGTSSYGEGDTAVRALRSYFSATLAVGHGGAVFVGLYPIVTFQYSSTTLYQVSYHIQ
jgi:hypothetical protein